jgi:hypothetical protein
MKYKKRDVFIVVDAIQLINNEYTIKDLNEFIEGEVEITTKEGLTIFNIPMKKGYYLNIPEKYYLIKKQDASFAYMNSDTFHNTYSFYRGNAKLELPLMCYCGNRELYKFNFCLSQTLMSFGNEVSETWGCEKCGKIFSIEHYDLNSPAKHLSHLKVILKDYDYSKGLEYEKDINDFYDKEEKEYQRKLKELKK